MMHWAVLVGWSLALLAVGLLEAQAQTKVAPSLLNFQTTSGSFSTGRNISVVYTAQAAEGTIGTVYFNYSAPYPSLKKVSLTGQGASATASALMDSSLPSGLYQLDSVTVRQTDGTSSTYFRGGALTQSSGATGPNTHSLNLAAGDFLGAYTQANTLPNLYGMRRASAGTLTGGSLVEIGFLADGNGGTVGQFRLTYLDPLGEVLEVIGSGEEGLATATLPRGAAAGSYRLDSVAIYSGSNSSIYITLLRDGTVLRNPVSLEGPWAHQFAFSALDFAVVASTASVGAPVITAQPRSQSVAYYSPLTLSVTVDGAYVGYQWFKNGQAIFGQYASSFSRPMAIETDSAAYHVVVTNAGGKVTSASAVVIVPHPSGPSITRDPASVEVATGQPATFSVVASSVSPVLKYQWLLDNRAIVGATAASYSVTAASSVTSGDYSVIVTNNTGSVLSKPATLRVFTPSMPAFTVQPLPISVTEGAPVSLSVSASGGPAPTFQWRKDGVALAGATSATLTISAAKLGDAGVYSVVATNPSGTVTSSAVKVAVTLPIINPARLVNLSINTSLAAGETMTLGTVLGGAGTRGTKPLLLRAVGPSLAAFGVPGVLPDPRLDLYSGQQVVAANDNWGGAGALAAAASSVGAFAFAGPGSADAAIYETALPAEAYTVQVKGVGTSAGVVLAEVYDATPAGTFTAATPRLINVSVLKQIRTGDSVTAGFVIDGTGSATVLVRAVGPALGQLFGVGGFMNDPKLTVYSGPTLLAANDNWAAQANGGASAISAATDAVGAFRLPDAASKDAVLLLTLRPGSYTAVVSGADGAGGLAITEIYEVP